MKKNNTGTPVYLHIKKVIRERIQSGEVEGGGQRPVEDLERLVGGHAEAELCHGIVAEEGMEGQIRRQPARPQQETVQAGCFQPPLLLFPRSFPQQSQEEEDGR